MERRNLRKRPRTLSQNSARMELDFIDSEVKHKKPRLSKTSRRNSEDVHSISSDSEPERQTLAINTFYGGRGNAQFPHSPSRRKAAAKILEKFCEKENLRAKPIQGKSIQKTHSKNPNYEFRTSSSDDTEPDWQPRVHLKSLTSVQNKVTDRGKVKLDVKKVAKTPKAKNRSKGTIEASPVAKENITISPDDEKTPTVVSGRKFFKTRSPASADRGSILIKKGFKLQFVARRLSIPKTPNSDSKVLGRGKQTKSKYVPSVSVSAKKALNSKNKQNKNGGRFPDLSLDISTASNIKDSLSEKSASQTKINTGNVRSLVLKPIQLSENLTPKDKLQAAKCIENVGDQVKDDVTVDSAIDTAQSEELFSSQDFYQTEIPCGAISRSPGSYSESVISTISSDDVASKSVDEDDESLGTGLCTPVSSVSESSRVASPASMAASEASLESGSGTGTPQQKLFPIFTDRRVSPPTSGGKKSSKKGSPAVTSLSRLRRHKETKEQMIIDAGQKKYGMTQCDKCNMVYTHDSQEDATLHEKFHQRVLHCLKFSGWKTERVVQEYGDGSRVIMVSSDDQAYKIKKVEEINSLMSEELGFSEVPFSKRLFFKAFLSISHTKMIEGCCLTEEVTEGYPVLADSPCSSEHSLASVNHPAHRPYYCSDTPHTANIGISRIWVNNSSRRSGVATKLLECVRHWAFYGMVIPKSRIAFSDPTPDGRILATRYTGTHSFLVYKYCNV